MTRFQVLAKKMTVLYKLAKEQLSKQYHYDFGLRALKSVLVMAGELKRGAAELDEASVAFIMQFLKNKFFIAVVDTTGRGADASAA